MGITWWIKIKFGRKIAAGVSVDGFSNKFANRGVNVDKTTAHEWFSKSAEQGNELALIKIFAITS